MVVPGEQALARALVALVDESVNGVGGETVYFYYDQTLRRGSVRTQMKSRE